MTIMSRFLAIFLLCNVVAATANSDSRDEAFHLRGLDEDILVPSPYHRLLSVDYSFYAPLNYTDMEACIQVENGTAAEGQPLILGDCNSNNGGQDGWKLDSYLFRSELNSSYCIQAGKNDIPRGGNALRLSWCDSSKSSQKFVYHPEVGIRPLVNQTLCVVWKGITPTIVDQIDPIIINQCLNVSGRLGWLYDVEVS